VVIDKEIEMFWFMITLAIIAWIVTRPKDC